MKRRQHTLAALKAFRFLQSIAAIYAASPGDQDRQARLAHAALDFADAVDGRLK